jgi:hypothetical protein
MTCAQTRALVVKNGAIVIGTGPDLYDRFVSDARFCSRAQHLEASWIRTIDVAQCAVGYRCGTRRSRRR